MFVEEAQVQGLGYTQRVQTHGARVEWERHGVAGEEGLEKTVRIISGCLEGFQQTFNI